MAYSDNYPNGYKSGYSSADDPDRKDYSPYGWERAKREAGSGIRETGDSAVDWYREIERKQEEKRQQEEWERQQERKKHQEHSEMRIETIKYLYEQKRNNYKKKSFFSKAVLTLQGKGYYKTPFWDLAVEEVNKMSDSELKEFHGRNVR